MKESYYHSFSYQMAKIDLHVVPCRVKYIVQTAPQVAVVGTEIEGPWGSKNRYVSSCLSGLWQSKNLSTSRKI